MPHLLVDPNTTQCPNYSLDIYHTIRVPFITPDSDHHQVAIILTTVWGTQNTVKKQQWQNQLDQDAAEADERRQEREEIERVRQEEWDKEKEKQRKDERKKNKSKFIPILARGVPTTPPIIVSALATWHMDKGDYVHTSLVFH